MCGIIIFYSYFRPTAEEAGCHCLFWSEKKQLQFLVEVNNFIRDKRSPAFIAIEENASIVFKGSWKEHITFADGQYLMSFFK